MSKPTCRELLDYVGHGGDPEELADRVERVLALHSKKTSSGSCAHCFDGNCEQACQTVRIMNGEEP